MKGSKRADVRLEFAAPAGKAFVPFLRREMRRIFELVPTRVTELSIALVGAKRMAGLHREFMSVDGPTDVLTFAMEADDRGRPTSGQLVICVEVARRQARARHGELRHELLLYALHGLLHLSGFDDRNAPDYARMHRTEDRVLTRLGIGPVFAMSDGSGKHPPVI